MRHHDNDECCDSAMLMGHRGQYYSTSSLQTVEMIRILFHAYGIERTILQYIITADCRDDKDIIPCLWDTEDNTTVHHLQTVEMIRILNNNWGGKMQLAICWTGSSHLHLMWQKSNCSSHIVTPFIDLLFGVIHSRILSEKLLSVIVTHSSYLFSIFNLLTAWWAESPNSIVTAIINYCTATTTTALFNYCLF